MKQTIYRLRSVDVRTVGFVDASSILAISTSRKKSGEVIPRFYYF